MVGTASASVSLLATLTELHCLWSRGIVFAYVTPNASSPCPPTCSNEMEEGRGLKYNPIKPVLLSKKLKESA